MHDYPIELSPFARATDDDPTLTERFEYFAGGMELGNAFSEINDAATQQERFDMQAGHVDGERGDPDYVEALSYGMPPTGGLGFGIDRFVMLLTGRETIRDVVLFPALRSTPGESSQRGASCERSNAITSARMSSSERVRSPAGRCLDLRGRGDPVQHVLDALPVDLVVREV